MLPTSAWIYSYVHAIGSIVSKVLITRLSSRHKRGTETQQVPFMCQHKHISKAAKSLVIPVTKLLLTPPKKCSQWSSLCQKIELLSKLAIMVLSITLQPLCIHPVYITFLLFALLQSLRAIFVNLLPISSTFSSIFLPLSAACLEYVHGRLGGGGGQAS